MSVQFSPSWEYYVPDAEIEEAMATPRRDVRKGECLATITGFIAGRKPGGCYETHESRLTRPGGTVLAEFAAAWNRGEKVKRLLAVFGVSYPILSRWRRELGLPRRRRVPGPASARIDAAIRDGFERGRTDAQTAARLGLTPGQVSGRRHKLGLRCRPSFGHLPTHLRPDAGPKCGVT